MAAFGAALIFLLAFMPWESTAQAKERQGRGDQITLEHGGDASLQPALAEAASRGDFQPEIVGGEPVSNGTYRFMAYIEILTNDNRINRCGGTLIDRDSVLTAAHCLENAKRAAMYVGRTDLSKKQGQIRRATHAFSHPRFNSRFLEYDAAVLKLKRPVTGIRPIALATANQDYLEKPGRILTVAGWGAMANGSFPNRMRKASVPVVSDSRAKRLWDPLLVPGSYVRPIMVAAGGQGKGVCRGDSGGPLFAPGSRTQVGITSFGKCGPRRYPGVYAEVNNPSIRNFILAAANR
jgi:trypsin